MAIENPRFYQVFIRDTSMNMDDFPLLRLITRGLIYMIYQNMHRPSMFFQFQGHVDLTLLTMCSSNPMCAVFCLYDPFCVYHTNVFVASTLPSLLYPHLFWWYTPTYLICWLGLCLCRFLRKKKNTTSFTWSSHHLVCTPSRPALFGCLISV